MTWSAIALLTVLLVLGARILNRRSTAGRVPSASRRKRSAPVTSELTTTPRELDDSNSWQIVGIRTAEEFFREVPSLLPEATIMYLEGSPTPDVVDLLRDHIKEGSYGAPIGTIWSWPKNERYSLTASPQLFGGLAHIATRHAEPEICSHLHFYRSEEPLANWFDAFDDPFIVSQSIPRERVERFCAALGVTYTDAAA